MDYIIATEQLTKKYKNFTSVNNVSIHVRRDSICGFLGPNGAGKSTTMKMLLGLTAPTKCWENLDVIRRILDLRKNTVEDALELVGLSEFGDRLAKKYSLGMKQRLDLAGASADPDGRTADPALRYD
jgi:ABC-2 type transport system ATP-binding protein